MKLNTEFKLKEALIAMGVTRMFSDNAELAGISDSHLVISDAVHKAVFEVSGSYCS